MFERGDQTERYYLDAHGPDDEGVKLAVAWLTEFALEGGHDRATLFTPTLAQVDRLAEILGLNPSRVRKDGAFRVRGIRVEVVSERQAQHRRLEGPVLGLWVDDRQLEKRLDGLDVPGLCVIPWNRTDIEQWNANWNPTELRSGEAAGQAATVGNPVVEAALESLTTSVNLSTGLAHPSDKSAAVQAFRVLRDGGERFNHTEVQAWAVRHGWRPQDARELAELAQKILEGRPIPGGRPHWREDILERGSHVSST